jgi:hypothetical protein
MLNHDLTQEQFINALYEGILGREPEAGALDVWKCRMEEGRSVQDVVLDFLECPEFIERKKIRGRLFVPPGHFYSPIVDVDSVGEVFEAPAQRYLPGITLDHDALAAQWQRLSQHLGRFPFARERSQEFRYYTDNPAFGISDASIYFAMLLEYRPRRIIEVGSGYSSACALDTVERYLDWGVNLTFIEPYPELLHSLMRPGDMERVRIVPHPAQEVALDEFDSLLAGDMLFIDSTHVLKTGSDVQFELFDLLPRLKPGVLIHIHDIFWPFEYPKRWVVDEGRSWNELYGIRALLMYQDVFEIVYFNDYAGRYLRAEIVDAHPGLLENTGGSLWLRKKR